MRRIFVFAACLLLTACTQQQASPVTPITSASDSKSYDAVPIIAQTAFQDDEQRIFGDIYVYDVSPQVLRIEDFSAQSVPSAHVWLASDSQGTNHIDLGATGTTQGNVSFVIPASVTIKSRPFVLLTGGVLNKIYVYANLFENE
jgi:hypothetical protein